MLISSHSNAGSSPVTRQSRAEPDLVHGRSTMGCIDLGIASLARMQRLAGHPNGKAALRMASQRFLSSGAMWLGQFRLRLVDQLPLVSNQHPRPVRILDAIVWLP